MTVRTRSQKLAQAAFPRVQFRREALPGPQFKEYTSFTKKFPALIHTCGLAQAVAFALAKQETNYIDDLTAVLRASGHQSLVNRALLATQTRDSGLGPYLRLSRDAINAASWLKRYVEAVGEDS